MLISSVCVCVCVEEGETRPTNEESDDTQTSSPQSQLVRWKSVIFSEVQVKLHPSPLSLISQSVLSSLFIVPPVWE